MTEAMRVHELAKQYDLPSKAVLEILAASSEVVRSASSKLTESQVDIVIRALTAGPRARPSDTAKKPALRPSSEIALPEPALDVHRSIVRKRVAAQPTAEESISSTLAGVQPAQVDAIDSSGRVPDSNPAAYLRSLIGQSFAAAKAAGKQDWREMSTAVLKNRMSQVSGTKFDQRIYGYPRILDLVRDFPDLLLIDENKTPPLVRLIEARDAKPVDESVQIRGDLWRAIIDYESGDSYVLVNGVAVRTSQIASQDAASGPLPTITPAELDGWRRDFATASSGLISERSDLVERLRDWADNRRPTRDLPGTLQGRWNLHQKNAVLEKLRSWFSDQGLEVPADLTTPTTRVKRPELARKLTDEARLRQILLECISKMPFEELKQINLPATSLLRLRS